MNDELSWFTNYGNCTTFYAPGQYIVSVNANDSSNPKTLSGTSMACPFVAGMIGNIVRFTQFKTPKQVKQAITHLFSTQEKRIVFIQPIGSIGNE